MLCYFDKSVMVIPGVFPVFTGFIKCYFINRMSILVSRLLVILADTSLARLVRKMCVAVLRRLIEFFVA